MEFLSPTPYPDVNEILRLLTHRVNEILQDKLVGMYLHGSLANGGFDRDSDIDIIFVSKEEVSEDAFAALQSMHKETAKLDSPWANQLEVSYFPIAALRRFDPANNLHPHLDRGQGEILHRIRHESDWIIQRYILRERGIVIAGPDPKSLVEPVSRNDLRQAVVDGLPTWLNPLLVDPSEMNKRGAQSFYVLSLCRMLYTLRHGEILSKQAAAEWGIVNLGDHWKPLIEHALVGRQNPEQATSQEDIRQTLELMRYMLRQIQPTPYPDVNAILDLLLPQIKEILQDQFVGMYLYGSLSSGDFNPKSSDIDFAVVTSGELTRDKIAALETMHHQLWATGMRWASRLEGAYVPKDMIRRHNADGIPCATVNEGKFYLDRLGSDWIIQRHVLREWGVVIEGPAPPTLIDPVWPDDIRSAVRGVLQEWWFPMLEDPSWLKEHGSNYHGYAVITMCRALHAMEHGTIVSKPKAIEWVKKRLDTQWHPLIEQAVASQLGIHSDFINETIEFIRFTRQWISNQESSVHDT